jgi:LPS export ABC transporter protein LptC
MLKHILQHNIKFIAAIFIVAMFFSCGNDYNKVNDFLADKNLPIGVTKNIDLIQTVNGKVKNKLKTSLLFDYNNREKHPYQEFPEGLKMIIFDKKGDSTTITADYSITYTKTSITELKGHVFVLNHAKKYTLRTEQLYWDQKENYFYSDKKSIFTRELDTINGLDGFDSNSDLTNYVVLNNNGNVFINE